MNDLELIKSMPLEELKKLFKEASQKKRDSEIKVNKIEATTSDLSKAQKRMLFLSEFCPLYHSPSCIHIKTTFDFDFKALEKSFNKVIAEHEILRTTFDLIKQKQIINPELHLKIDYQDLRNKNNNEEIVKKNIKTLNNKPFDLREGPLLRFNVFHLNHHEYIFVLIFHHIISDGWTNTLIFRDIVTNYILFKDIPHLKNPSGNDNYQYKDFIDWEKRFIDNDKGFQKSLRFWEEEIKSFSPVTLPADYRQNSEESFLGSSEFLKIDSETSQVIKEICKNYKVTSFELILSIYFFLIYEYTNESTISIGSTTVNRLKREFENTAGLFTNTVVFNVKISNIKLHEFILEVAKKNRDILNHQGVPFDILVKELNPERKFNNTSLLPIFFSYQSFPKMFDYEGVKAKPYKVDYNISYFDLELAVEEAEDTFFLTVNYLEALYNPKTIKTFLFYLESIFKNLKQLINHPIEEIDFSFLEYKTENSENIPKIFDPYPDYNSFIEYFESNTKSNPNDIALIYKSQKLTYKQLDERANQLAYYLQKNDVKKGDIVGLYFDISEFTVISILAILKCRATYVGFERNTPKERLNYMIKDTKLSILLTDKEIDYINTKVINVDEIAEDLNQQKRENPNTKASKEDIIHIIYTSGSTGRPKGVCITNENLLTFLKDVHIQIPPLDKLKFGYLNSISTDIGNMPLFFSLYKSCPLTIVPFDLIYEPQKLSDYVLGHDIDCFIFTPTHLKIIMNSKYAKKILPRKILLIAGEILDCYLVKDIRKHSNCEIYNFYGPSETTITSTIFKINRDIPLNFKNIPIGYPLKNTKLLILNKRQKVIPEGGIGELYIGGKSVSTGYLNMQKLNKEKFMEISGDRFYKTGDLVRYRNEDKALEFVGRMDNQEKLNGYRVELYEIEITLEEQEEIIKAAVKMDEHKEMLAFIEIKNKSIDVDNLKIVLQEKLPYYMIPAKFIITKIPLLANGKIDYRSLNNEIQNSNQKIKVFISPRNTIELKLINIWKDILKNKDIGINENFFHNGGHSLLAMKMVDIIEQELEVKISVNSLFKYPTVEQLGKVISEKKVINESVIVNFHKCRNPKLEIYFIHPAGGNVFTYYPMNKYLNKNFDFNAIQFPFHLKDHHLLGRDVKKMASFYLKEVLKSKKDVIPIFAGWSLGAAIAHEMSCQYNKIYNTDGSKVILIDYKIAINKNGSLNESMLSESEEMEYDINFIKKIETFSNIKFNLYDKLRLSNKKERNEIIYNYFRKIRLISLDLEINKFLLFLDIQRIHNIASDNFIPEKNDSHTLIIKAKDYTFEDKREVDNFLGWRQYLRKKPEVVDSPGNHITMMREENINFISDKINKWLKAYV